MIFQDKDHAACMTIEEWNDIKTYKGFLSESAGAQHSGLNLWFSTILEYFIIWSGSSLEQDIDLELFLCVLSRSNCVGLILVGKFNNGQGWY